MNYLVKFVGMLSLATSLVGCATPGSLEEISGVAFGSTLAEVAAHPPCHLTGLKTLPDTPWMASDSCNDLPVLGSPHYGLLVYDHGTLIGVLTIAVDAEEARAMEARITERFGERQLLDSGDSMDVFGREQDGIVDATMKSGSWLSWVTPSHAEFPLTLAARVFAESGLRVSAPEPAIIKTGN